MPSITVLPPSRHNGASLAEAIGAAGWGIARSIRAALPRKGGEAQDSLPFAWVSVGVSLMLLVLSMPLAAGEVSPRGSDIRVLRQAGVSAGSTVRPAGLDALKLEQQGLASGQPQLLEAAVQAFEKSLDDPAIGASTRAWTESQIALANKKLATINRDQGLLKQAIAGYRSALGFYSKAADKRNAGIVSANLLAALLELKGQDAARISGAEIASLADAALDATNRGTEPLVWARLQVQIGTLLLATGARARDIPAVQRAVAALRSGLDDAQHNGLSPGEWAEAENLLANALEYLGNSQGSTSLLHEALKTLNNAWVLYQYAGLDQYQFFFDGRISTLQARLAQLDHPAANSSPILAVPTGTGSAESQAP